MIDDRSMLAKDHRIGIERGTRRTIALDIATTFRVSYTFFSALK
jgi:hypothetical protein